ncbi:MAG: hypothetical protein AAFN74_25905, partial [Myxococcota bacterium]
ATAAVAEAEQTAAELLEVAQAKIDAFNAAYAPYTEQQLTGAASAIEYIREQLTDPSVLIQQPETFLNGLDVSSLPEVVASALSPLLELADTLSTTDEATIERQNRAKTQHDAYRRVAETLPDGGVLDGPDGPVMKLRDQGLTITSTETGYAVHVAEEDPVAEATVLLNAVHTMVQTGVAMTEIRSTVDRLSQLVEAAPHNADLAAARDAIERWAIPQGDDQRTLHVAAERRDVIRALDIGRVRPDESGVVIKVPVGSAFEVSESQGKMQITWQQPGGEKVTQHFDKLTGDQTLTVAFGRTAAPDEIRGAFVVRPSQLDSMPSSDEAPWRFHAVMAPRRLKSGQRVRPPHNTLVKAIGDDGFNTLAPWHQVEALHRGETAQNRIRQHLSRQLSSSIEALGGEVSPQSEVSSDLWRPRSAAQISAGADGGVHLFIGEDSIYLTAAMLSTLTADGPVHLEGGDLAAKQAQLRSLLPASLVDGSVSTTPSFADQASAAKANVLAALADITNPTPSPQTQSAFEDDLMAIIERIEAVDKLVEILLAIGEPVAPGEQGDEQDGGQSGSDDGDSGPGGSSGTGGYLAYLYGFVGGRPGGRDSSSGDDSSDDAGGGSSGPGGPSGPGGSDQGSDSPDYRLIGTQLDWLSLTAASYADSDAVREALPNALDAALERDLRVAGLEAFGQRLEALRLQAASRVQEDLSSAQIEAFAGVVQAASQNVTSQGADRVLSDLSGTLDELGVEISGASMPRTPQAHTFGRRAVELVQAHRQTLAETPRGEVVSLESQDGTQSVGVVVRAMSSFKITRGDEGEEPAYELTYRDASNKFVTTPIDFEQNSNLVVAYRTGQGDERGHFV